ncbi:hypothetical protein VaNZ11_014733 [Volvox africanus]|uniref:Mini-chromosome maintenance complex-binding protein n=1 Tax=Volvox africanus TaxID=51714 RepID=A0ABQ5SK08_9CHLO|nr:hypothetical protein VaNZ11_014733 [Volvox africanus]
MTVSEIVARPIETIQRLFQQAGCPSITDADWGVVKYFQEAIVASGESEIPRLNEQSVDRLPHHSLVRFYGMVQDLLNPEYYVGAYQRPNGEWVTTKFSDPDMSELEKYDSCGQPIVWERRPVVCVPIPGLSTWTLPIDGWTIEDAPLASAYTTLETAIDQPTDPQVQAQPGSRAAKRERSSDADAQLHASGDNGAGVVSASSTTTSQLDEEDSMQDTDPAADQGSAPSVAAADAMDESVTRPRVRRREDLDAGGAGRTVRSVDVVSDAAAPTRVRHLPSEASSGVSSEEVPGSCMIYLYDNAPAIVLHEVVEIIGVLSHMPQLATLDYENQDPPLEHDLASLELSGGGGGVVTANGLGNSEPVEANQFREPLVLEAIRGAHPPTSKVMRLHAIIVHRNPPLVSTCSEAATAASSSTAATDPVANLPPPVLARPAVAALRDRALGLLQYALGGDAVAAEYVLLQLLGRVATRGDPTVLGQLTLNLCRCPASSTTDSAVPASCAVHSSLPLVAERLERGPGPLCAALHAAISCLVPLSVALPLTVESCNGVSWAPQRDSVRERTRPSPLQLAPGTVVLLDETLMAPGQLKPEGVASMQALAGVSRRQELMYDFETFHHPVPVDLPLIILTEGRSLLRDSVHVRIPLNATQPFPTAEEVLTIVNGGTCRATGADTPMAPDDGSTAANPVSAVATDDAGKLAVELAAVRCYLADARTATEGYELADGMSAVLEQYFVDARRQEAGGGNPTPAGANGVAAGGGLTAEEFHTKLTMARLLVLSHGERKLTREWWQQLLHLEHTREARLRVMD